MSSLEADIIYLYRFVSIYDIFLGKDVMASNG